MDQVLKDVKQEIKESAKFLKESIEATIVQTQAQVMNKLDSIEELMVSSHSDLKATIHKASFSQRYLDISVFLTKIKERMHDFMVEVTRKHYGDAECDFGEGTKSFKETDIPVCKAKQMQFEMWSFFGCTHHLCPERIVKDDASDP